MLKISFERSKFDNCVYIRRSEFATVLYLLWYVNDMLVVSADQNQINQLKVKLEKEFEMKELGEAKRILGVVIFRDKSNSELFLFQTSYIKKVLRKFNMNTSKPLTIPLSIDCKLSKNMCPNIKEEEKEMITVPYSNVE